MMLCPCSAVLADNGELAFVMSAFTAVSPLVNFTSSVHYDLMQLAAKL